MPTRRAISRPVSYTHLEKVLMPPMPLAAIIASANMLPPVCPTLTPRLETVSYTHLDVYKRQEVERVEQKLSVLPLLAFWEQTRQGDLQYTVLIDNLNSVYNLSLIHISLQSR